MQNKPSDIPAEAMKKLYIINGHWLSTLFMTQDGGKTWNEYPKRQVRVNSLLNGLLLEQSNVKHDPNSWNMKHSLSYDQYRQTYRQSIMDDTWGLMDIYEGNIDNQGLLTVDNIKSGTLFPGQNNTWFSFRLKIELKNCVRHTHVDVSADKGTTWLPYMRFKYENLDDPSCTLPSN